MLWKRELKSEKEEVTDSLTELIDKLKPKPSIGGNWLPNAFMLLPVLSAALIVSSFWVGDYTMAMWLSIFSIWATELTTLFMVGLSLWLVWNIGGTLFNPVRAYGSGLQKRMEREAALRSYVIPKPIEQLEQFSQRAKLESQLIQRRITFAGFCVAACGFLISNTSHAIQVGVRHFDLLWLVPYLLALATGVTLGALLIYGVVERLDRLGLVLDQVIEARRSKVKLRYEPSSALRRDRRGTP